MSSPFLWSRLRRSKSAFHSISIRLRISSISASGSSPNKRSQDIAQIIPALWQFPAMSSQILNNQRPCGLHRIGNRSHHSNQQVQSKSENRSNKNPPSRKPQIVRLFFIDKGVKRDRVQRPPPYKFPFRGNRNKQRRRNHPDFHLPFRLKMIFTKFRSTIRLNDPEFFMNDSGRLVHFPIRFQHGAH